jgi:hypothetical protein
MAASSLAELYSLPAPSRKRFMSLPFKPCTTEWDQLLLGGHLLALSELGRIRMDAEGYRDIAVWMDGLLKRIPVEDVRKLTRTGPRQLRVLAENVLGDRGERRWSADWLGGHRAQAMCETLLDRINLRSRRQG